MRLSWEEKISSDGFRYSQPINAETGEDVDNVILTSVEVGIDHKATMTFTVRLDYSDEKARRHERPRVSVASVFDDLAPHAETSTVVPPEVIAFVGTMTPDERARLRKEWAARYRRPSREDWMNCLLRHFGYSARVGADSTDGAEQAGSKDVGE